MAVTAISGCIGCGECVRSCPTDVLRLDTTGRAVIRWPQACQLCHLCRLYCPVDAITITPEKSVPVTIAWG